jgi:vacuolar-type H+-ATPase subunit E/Vma4
MIEEFVQGLRQAEIEAKDIVKAAKEKAQTIERDSQARLAALRSSADLSLQQRIGALDQESQHEIRLAQDQLQQDIQEGLQSVERSAREHKDAALNFLLSELISH